MAWPSAGRRHRPARALGDNDVVDTEPAPHATGVSAREAEVLAGVAEHLTNAEIAERLVISVRTDAR